jgi:hypothetical protein
MEQSQLSNEELFALLTSGMFLYRLLGGANNEDPQTRDHLVQLNSANQKAMQILKLSDVQIQQGWEQTDNMVESVRNLAS